MRRPKASWNAIISAFLHALNFAPSLGACALPLTGVSALCFKGVLFPPQQRLLFKANNYNASYVKPHKIIMENSIFFPYLFRKRVDLRFASNMKLHYQNAFVIKKMYRFSNTHETTQAKHRLPTFNGPVPSWPIDSQNLLHCKRTFH